MSWAKSASWNCTYPNWISVEPSSIPSSFILKIARHRDVRFVYLYEPIASVIVTFNLRDFPGPDAKALQPVRTGIPTISSSIYSVCIRRGSARLQPIQPGTRNPLKTADEYLDTPLKQGLTETVALLREWKMAIRL